MHSYDCYKFNVLFIIIIKAEERLHLLSHHMCSAGMRLFLASNKELIENKYCVRIRCLANSHLRYTTDWFSVATTF